MAVVSQISSMRRHRDELLYSAALIAFLFATLPVASSIPMYGTSTWMVLLCKFSDKTSVIPQNTAFFQDFWNAAGLDNIRKYWQEVSDGVMDIQATVQGWYTMSLRSTDTTNRCGIITACVNAAASAGVRAPAGTNVAAMINFQKDSGAACGKLVLDPLAWFVSFAAHEMGHVYGLGHSYSDDLTYQNAPWSQRAEYDDMWDLMSVQHVYWWYAARFSPLGPSLNGPLLDYFGWLPSNRIATFGADGATTSTYTLSPLTNRAATTGVLLIRVPFSVTDVGNYYTVEFRVVAGQDRGIPQAAVLVHEWQNSIVRSTLKKINGGPQWLAGSAFVNAINDVRVTVNSVSSTNAVVTITSGIAKRCLTGFVWREAVPGDKVCVTGATRTQVRADNAAASSRWTNGAYGPNTCINGYVWREATPIDHVCVSGAQRTQAQADNSAAWSRANPAKNVWGPNRCKVGYVWRGAGPSDYVCVAGTVRDQVQLDNSLKATRWVVGGAWGPYTCANGFVWREAYTGDYVCVLPAQRTQAANDNAAAGSRVLV